MQFFMSRDGNISGPWGLDAIAEGMISGQFLPTDHVYLESKKEWVMLLDWEEVRSRLKKSVSGRSSQQTLPPPGGETKIKVEQRAEPVRIAKKAPIDEGVYDEPEWCTISSQNIEFNDLSTRDVISMLQEKKLFEFDLIRRRDVFEWRRIAEHPYFNREAIRQLLAQEPKKWPFHQRRYPRIPFNTQCYVHDSRQVWSGESYEGGEGGSGLFITNPLLYPGQKILIHFMAQSLNDHPIPAFNVECEIVSKGFVGALKRKKASVQYGVRFIKFDHSIEKEIMKLFRVKGEQWIQS